ncbi:MAG: hypothetical protein ACRD5H_04090 [Nitrososphaerales archaeon]
MSKQVLIQPLPPTALGAYRIAAQTGLIAATLAADSPLFSFRWGNLNNFAVVDYVDVSVIISAAITTAVPMGLDLVIARAFTTSDSGGTAITPTGDMNKLKTNFDTTLVTDIRIATTGTLTAGTRTLDTDAIGQVIFGTGTTVATALAQTILFDRATTSYPLVLARNEGFIIRNTLAGPATGSFILSVDVGWIEMGKQVF